VESPFQQSGTPTNCVFATTRYTMLGEWLERGEDGRIEASNHIMQTYERPLQVYYLGSSFAQDLGDAADIVRGFFADRLSKPGFLHGWLRGRKRLRYWLMTAFKHYLYEQRNSKSHKKNQMQSLVAIDDNADEANSPERAFHREVALAIVRQALDRARATCCDDGLDVHWEAMQRHHLDGRSFSELSKEFGVDTGRLRVMARTAGNRFRRCLREELAWPGARQEDIDREIRSLMEVLHL
jgi:DNA-directed RNA polymerase specialized sigma24 family protein